MSGGSAESLCRDRDKRGPQGIEVMSETLIFFSLTKYAFELKRVIHHHLIPHSSHGFILLVFLRLCNLLVALSLSTNVRKVVYGLHGRAMAFPFAQIFN